MGCDRKASLSLCIPERLIEMLRKRGRAMGRSNSQQVESLLDLLDRGQLFLACSDSGLVRLTSGGSVRVRGSRGAAGLCLQEPVEHGCVDGKSAGVGD